MEEKNIYSEIPEGYATPPLNFNQDQDRSASIIKQLSPQEHLQEQIAWLRGELWDKNTGSFKKIEGIKPFMNAEGIEMFFQYATSLLSPIVTFSNYQTDKQIIHRIILSITNDATVHFHLHWKDYDIRRKTQINILKTKLMILGLSALYKALGAGDRNAGTRNISENISTLMRNFGEGGQMPQQRPGIFSKMNPFSK